MKDCLSIWLATYEEPEPRTLSHYGNLCPESGEGHGALCILAPFWIQEN